MSKFFNQMQQAGRSPQKMQVQPPQVEQLLEQIQEVVDEQVSGIQLQESLALDNCIENLKSGLGGTGVAEFPQTSYRRFRVPRAAARVFFPEQEDKIAPPGLEAYRTLRTRLLRRQGADDIRSIVISSAAAGDGKTLTVLNIAIQFAQLPQFPVLVVDADLRTSGLSRLMGDPPPPGLAEMLGGKISQQAAVLESDIPNLYLAPAGEASAPAPELFTGPRWGEFMAWARQDFKLVLVDSPPALPLADYDLISPCCDRLMLMARAGVTQRAGLEKVVEHIDRGKLLGVLLNSVSSGDQGSYYYYNYHYGHRDGKHRDKTTSTRPRRSRWFSFGRSNGRSGKY